MEERCSDAEGIGAPNGEREVLVVVFDDVRGKQSWGKGKLAGGCRERFVPDVEDFAVEQGQQRHGKHVLGKDSGLLQKGMKGKLGRGSEKDQESERKPAGKLGGKEGRPSKDSKHYEVREEITKMIRDLCLCVQLCWVCKGPGAYTNKVMKVNDSVCEVAERSEGV